MPERHIAEATDLAGLVERAATVAPHIVNDTHIDDTPGDLARDGRALRDALCAFIDEAVSLDPGVPVRPDTDLLLTGLVDSLGVVQIVSWIESELGITVEPTDVVLEHFQTVDAMADFVARRTAREG